MLKDYLVVIILILLLYSGSSFASSYNRSKFEAAFPLTIIFVIFLEFIFGLVGLLEIGFYLSSSLLLISFLICVYRCFCHNENAFLKIFLEPTFLVYIVVSFALLFLNYGKLMASWDEFSHWGDVVKAMTTLDVISTNPVAESLFPEYPPAMALFQYFAEKLYMLLTGKPMAEWLLYYSYQLFMFSLYFPFVGRLDLKKTEAYIILAVFFLIPAVFQDTVYSKIYIDPFLSSVFGILLVTIIDDKDNDKLHHYRIFAYFALLVLTKSIGIVLAIIALVVFSLKEGKKQVSIATLCIVIPTLAWQISIKINGVKSAFSLTPINTVNPDYVKEILARYFRLLARSAFTSEEAMFPTLPFFAVFPILMLVLYLSLRNQQKGRTIFWILFVLDVLFVLGLGLAYAYVFSIAEAETMNQARRYINNLLMAQSILIIMLVYDKKKYMPVIILGIVLLFTPIQSTARFITRREVAYSQSYRQPYDIICSKVLELTDEANVANKSLVVETEKDDSMIYMILRTELRPMKVVVCYLPGDADKFEECVSSGYDFYANFDEGEVHTFNSKEIA